jgi:DNA-binding transcriptional regulator YhcF (GntR family)
MEPTITNLPDRPRPQQERIIQTLRNAIITGELAPGDRIPPRRELAEQLSASLLTVQQALDRLAREGFVKPRGRLGTFVVDRPPHLTQYALVFEHRPNNRQFPRFWSALAQETHGLSSPDITVKPWYGVEAHADNEDFQRLCGLVRSHRIGGIIFPASPHPYLNSPLLDEPGISRVAPLTPDTVSLFPTVRPVYLAPMLERALEYFASRGR